MLFKSPPPAQVVWQVMGCHAVEACQPLLEPTVISVDVLHMVSAVDALALAIRLTVSWLKPPPSQNAV